MINIVKKELKFDEETKNRKLKIQEEIKKIRNEYSKDDDLKQ